MVDDRATFHKALDDFRKERSRAAMRHFWAGITGKSLDLLPYDEISAKLHATSRAERGLQTIPLDAIVGSVGRYYDFDRNFLPLRDNDINRWARVKTAMTSAESFGVPPISVYKIGEVYFVLDGNHRVSIAKQMGMKDIEAYVTEINTRVPLTPDVSPEELILKEEYVDFLEQTRLDQILPDLDFTLTFPGQYILLKEHIAVHQYYMGIDQNREVAYEEAVRHWFEVIYLPVVNIIEELGILHEFKDKTATDLYLWILDHQTQLQNELGWQVRMEKAVDDLARQEGKQVIGGSGRGEQHMEEVLEFDPSDLQSYEVLSESQLGDDCMFRDILVALSDLESGWDALEQAVRFNRCPFGEIRGLHVVGDEIPEPEKMEAMKTRFSDRLQAAGYRGKLVVAKGEISKLVTEHSLLNDLVVLKLIYPPTASLFDRFSSGFSSILRKIQRPILVVREEVSDLNNLLLAYDGSSKSKEALFMSAYLASRYGNQLTVITINNGSTDLEIEVGHARAYLERLNIPFTYLMEEGEVTNLVVNAIESMHANLLLLGGYGHSSLLEVVFGSAVDTILRKITIPALICQ